VESLPGNSPAAIALPWAPALLAHDAAQLAAALAVVGPLLPPGTLLPLVTAPHAAAVLSPDLLLAMLAAGSAGYHAHCVPVLDCGIAAGHALGALRAGSPAVVLAPECPAWPSVQGVAAALNALLLPAPPTTLDLLGWRPDSAFGTARLRAWLAGDTA
jgi:hypothetical protein